MRDRILLLLLLALPLAASDDQRLVLTLKAQTAFDRAASYSVTPVPLSAECVQSQAAMLSISPPESLPLLHYRKGYCLLAGAAVTRNHDEFSSAAAEFDKAIDSWPLRAHKALKSAAPEPVISGLRVLDAIAHIQSDGEAGMEPVLQSALERPACVSDLMNEELCRQWISVGRLWLGRMELRDGRLDAAATAFAGSPDTGWMDWVLGKRAFASGIYAEAASRFAAAVQTWKLIWDNTGPSTMRRLGPRPELAPALADLGGALLLSGKTTEAIARLDASVRLDPASSRALYLRARAKEAAGQPEAALADYNLAARVAFAAAADLASGEAHLYRGILMFRRKDYSRAEDEFASALNFSINAGLRPDAEAWRHLAAVAGGACATARQNLERSLPSVSPYFPVAEARAIAAACRASAN